MVKLFRVQLLGWAVAGFSALIISPVASAGWISGGGGQGVVCRNQDGSIRGPVELLDLWEARTIYQRQLLKSGESVNAQLQAALERLKNFADYQIQSIDENGKATNSADALKEDLWDMAGIITSERDSQNAIFRKKIKLELSKDRREALSPDKPGCRIEQIVYWKDLPQAPLAEVNQDLLDHMDNTNKAALDLHEALYWYLRTYDGDKNSLRVRRTIGYVFSGNHFDSLVSKLKKPYIRCESIPRPPQDLDALTEDEEYGTLIYFVNRPSSTKNPESGMDVLVSHIRNIYPIDFANQYLMYPNVTSLYAALQKRDIPDSLRLVAESNPQIETETVIRLKLQKGGHATASLESATGEQQIHPDSDIHCTLEK